MSRRILIAGNWKMNKTSSEGAALVKEIAAGLPAGNLPEILVCPPYQTRPISRTSVSTSCGSSRFRNSMSRPTSACI